VLFEYLEISEDEFLDGIEIQGDMTSLSRPDNLTAETPFYASTHEGGSVVRVVLGHGSNWAGVANPRFTIHHISRGHLINCAESTLQADGSLPVKCPWQTWGKGPHTRLLMPDIPRQTWFGFPLAHRYTFTTPSLDSGVRIHVMDLKAIAARRSNADHTSALQPMGFWKDTSFFVDNPGRETTLPARASEIHLADGHPVSSALCSEDNIIIQDVSTSIVVQGPEY